MPRETVDISPTHRLFRLVYEQEHQALHKALTRKETTNFCQSTASDSQHPKEEFNYFGIYSYLGFCTLITASLATCFIPTALALIAETARLNLFNDGHHIEETTVKEGMTLLDYALKIKNIETILVLQQHMCEKHFNHTLRQFVDKLKAKDTLGEAINQDYLQALEKTFFKKPDKAETREKIVTELQRRDAEHTKELAEKDSKIKTLEQKLASSEQEKTRYKTSMAASKTTGFHAEKLVRRKPKPGESKQISPRQGK